MLDTRTPAAADAADKSSSIPAPTSASNPVSTAPKGEEPAAAKEPEPAAAIEYIKNQPALNKWLTELFKLAGKEEKGSIKSRKTVQREAFVGKLRNQTPTVDQLCELFNYMKDIQQGALQGKNHPFILIRHERSHTGIGGGQINTSSWQYMMHEVKKQIMDSLIKDSQKRDGKYLLSADQYDHYMAIMRIHTGRSLFTTWGKTASEKEFASKFVRTEIQIKPTATA